MFLKAVDCLGETKDKYFIYELMKEVIEEVGPDNVVQVIIYNAKNCVGAGLLIEGLYPNIFWTPCVVHTLNLALQNICAAKNVENNQVTYDKCSWITIIADDVSFIKNFIMNHSMRLAIFNDFVPLKLLSVASTCFASVMVMLKKFKLLKASLQTMVISLRWNSYREDDTGKAKFVKEKVLDDIWCYSDEWLNEGPSRVPSHKDVEVAQERMKCMKKYFPNSLDRSKVNLEFVNFSSKAGEFVDSDSIHDRLGFIHSNLRLLSRRTRQYMEGQTKMWDIAGDAFDSFGDVGELEIAQLSLDEPELEAVVFMDVGDESDDGEIGDEAMKD
ncbi:hypothetical protein RHGRI_007861 [Rhododendron griersonianum]|uniref:DUF659 domain-containing protein n=1 Tax=Rhododendron griersonianum TaxID=479676 RepID=A0AAV6KZQ5_9ERIC|nr:hypothetical protein RHGRI_007861 [Rhododendron griersonianum]